MAPNDYCIVSEVQEIMPDSSWSADIDSLLEKLIKRASRLIDRSVKMWDGFFFVSADATVYFDGSGGRELWVDAFAAVPTSISVAESGDVDGSAGSGGTYTAWAANDYYCWPYNAILQGRPFLRFDIDQLNGNQSIWPAYPRAVKIVGKYGYSVAIPDTIKQATIIQVVRWFKRGQQGFQDVGAISDLSQLKYVNKLDPDIQAVVESFMGMTI